MELSAKTNASIREHVLGCAPMEACGLVVANTYLPCRNIAENPKTDFLIDPHDQLNAERVGAIQAVIHSHVDQRIKSLSKQDMTSQQEMEIPWGVVFVRHGLASDPVFFGDQIKPPPLEGREFIHGIYDCWTLVRDYFRVNHKVTMPNPPRSWGWWEMAAGNLYLEGIMAGLPYIQNIAFEDNRDLVKLRAGDIVFAAVRSDRINHAAIYLGSNLILNHMVGGGSRIMPLSSGASSIRHVCRYVVEGPNA